MRKFTHVAGTPGAPWFTQEELLVTHNPAAIVSGKSLPYQPIHRLLAMASEIPIWFYSALDTISRSKIWPYKERCAHCGAKVR